MNKLDKLGRPTIGFSYINRNGLNASLTRKVPAEFDDQLHILWTKDQRKRVNKIAKRKNITAAELIRTYIEWGLENDKIS